MGANVDAGTIAQRESAPTLGGLLNSVDTISHTSEKEWVALVRAIAVGDTGAFGTLYMSTHGIVFTSLARITGHRATAEELTVEVFHDVWRSASTYDPASNTVVGWIMNLARARALPRSRADRGTLAAAMRAAVQRLTTGERRAIEDIFFSGLTYVEVAAREKVLTAMIKSRIRAGMGRLKTILTRGNGRR
jgi:RNA polymerase sigma-70 factor (ECF subfamily)